MTYNNAPSLKSHVIIGRRFCLDLHVSYTVKNRWSWKLCYSSAVQIARNLVLSVAKNGRRNHYALSLICLSSIWGKAFSATLYLLARNITQSVKYGKKYFYVLKILLSRHVRQCTVTRIDVIFRYPDQVPLTHFVHRAKKVFSMWAWIFCWFFCATRIFRWCNDKVFEHRVGANLRPSDQEADILPLRHSTLVYN